HARSGASRAQNAGDFGEGKARRDLDYRRQPGRSVRKLSRLPEGVQATERAAGRLVRARQLGRYTPDEARAAILSGRRDSSSSESEPRIASGRVGGGPG